MPQPRSRPKKITTQDLRRQDRSACMAVIDAYNQIRSTIGVEQAFDYSRDTGGQGAQFDPARKTQGFAFIDFVVDVEKAIKYALPEEQSKAVLKNMVGFSEELVRTVDRLEMEEKMGRVFVGRGLFPVRKYFVTIKR